jgi:hypothetical protein
VAGVGDWDLMTVYAAYLLLAVAAGAVIRARYAWRLAERIQDVRTRLPHLSAAIIEHWRLVMATPVLVHVGFGAALLVLHVALLQFVFLDARLSAKDLVASAWTLAAVVLVAGLVVVLDVLSLATAWRRQVPRIHALLPLVEASMASEGAVGAVSRGLFSRWLRRKALKSGLALNPWLRRWSLHLGLRILLGSTLWLAWGLKAA